jgi:ABC-type antimicrobial peptide transport system permease subunit
MALVLTGIAIGLVAAFWATGLIQRLLFGVESTDAATFIATALGFSLVATIACLIPAVRAARVDPVLTLKAE